jgi:hypothetical protein
LQTEHGLSERRACGAVSLQRSLYHYEPRPNADGPIVQLLLELAWQRPEQGFSKLFKAAASPGPRLEPQTCVPHLLQPETKQKPERQRRLPTRYPASLVVPEAMNECWSADFMRHSVEKGEADRMAAHAEWHNPRSAEARTLRQAARQASIDRARAEAAVQLRTQNGMRSFGVDTVPTRQQWIGPRPNYWGHDAERRCIDQSRRKTN